MRVFCFNSCTTLLPFIGTAFCVLLSSACKRKEGWTHPHVTRTGQKLNFKEWCSQRTAMRQKIHRQHTWAQQGSGVWPAVADSRPSHLWMRAAVACCQVTVSHPPPLLPFAYPHGLQTVAIGLHNDYPMSVLIAKHHSKLHFMVVLVHISYSPQSHALLSEKQLLLYSNIFFILISVYVT